MQNLDLDNLAERVADRVAAKLANRPNLTPDTESDRLVDERQAAKILTVQPATLAAWRCKGGGPVFLKVGSGKRSSIRYRLGDLRAWANERRYANTAHRLVGSEG